MKSRKALYEALKSIPDVAKLPDSYKGLSNEVYGRKACIYVTFNGEAARRTAERTLVGLGFKVDATYYPGSPTTSVQVSYFKGWHWDE